MLTNRSEVHQKQFFCRHMNSLKLNPVRIILPLFFCFIGIMYALLLTAQSETAYAATKHPTNDRTYADTVIMMDNINEIKTHDPLGARYDAAQIFIDQAQQGDRIGVVRITSAEAQNPTIIGLTTVQNDQDRSKLKQVLTQSYFGPVDPGPTAYFVPALKAAGQMLTSSGDSNRKYILIVTDSVAQSGDTGTCSSASDQYHNWFCEVSQLENENISVILLGFTAAYSTPAELQPTQQFLQSHGGIVLPVDDGAGLSTVAQTYTNISGLTHDNVFFASLNGVPKTINISTADHLSSLSFVVLGGNGIDPTLTSVITPGNTNVAGQITGDGQYYTAHTANYWLETIKTGDMGGTWQLATASPSNSLSLLVIGTSEAYFHLLYPGTASGSNISVRYVPAGTPVLLDAQVTDIGGNPMTDVSFTADPEGQNQPLVRGSIPLTTAIPGSFPSDISTSLPNTSGQLTIGLGSPITSGIDLEKQYQLVTSNDLANKNIQITQSGPTSQLPGAASLRVNAQGITSATMQSLGIFAHDQQSPNTWQLIAQSNSTIGMVEGSLPILHGCGDIYTILAIEDISGTFAQGQYNYLASATTQYTSQLQQAILSRATLVSDKNLSIWPMNNQATWKVSLSSSMCQPQDMQLRATQPLVNGNGTFTVPANSTTVRTITVSLGSCPFRLISNQAMSVPLSPLANAEKENIFIKQGDWQPSLNCPSLVSYGVEHPPLGIALLFLLSILLVRGVQIPPLFLLPGMHLEGKAEIHPNASELTDTTNGDILTRISVDVPIPRAQYATTWYLARRLEGGDIIYSFDTRESRQALLRFDIQKDISGYYITKAASKHATGNNMPVSHLTGLPLGTEPGTYDNEPIVIGQDLIYPQLEIVR